MRNAYKKTALRFILISLFFALLFLPFTGPKASAIMFTGIFILLIIFSALKKIRFKEILKEIPLIPFEKIKIFFILAIAVLLTASPFMLEDYHIDVMIMAGIYIILALGLNVIVGLTGLLNLGFAAFYAIGAYTYALANTKLGLSFWASLPFSALFSAFFGFLLSIPALRLRGDYLAIVTLGFGEIMRLTLNNWDSLTNGPNGITGIQPPVFLGISLDKPNLYYYLVLLFVLISIIIIRRIECSKIGRAWVAIRENEIAASTLGINTTKYKIYAFTFGTFWAGIAGILFSAKMRFISPESFTFLESILILSMVILGGLGNTYGTIIGASILVILPEFLRGLQLYRMLLLGIGLVLLMIFRPQGILGKIKNVHFRG